MNLDAPGSDDLLDQLLAELDENPDAPVDSTVRNLHAELATLAGDLRQPLPLDPYAEESALRLAVARAKEIGREASSRSANAVETSPPSDLGHVGPYRLLEKLGQGGMGTVYKALHVRLDKIVALKLLSAERTRSDEAKARFAREMKAVGKLDHPHIVRTMDAGEADGAHYLVMEYVNGVDFSETLKRTGRLSVAESCELIRQAARGLQAAHSRGMVHRDVKPANLMLATQDDGPPIVKVLDLGLALLSDATGGDVGSLTTDGRIMGTLDYMAPEQAGDSHAVDIRADIYSLGATLYALLTGGSVFHGRVFKTALHRISALANEQIPPITDRRDDVPPALAAIVHRMLARDPADRFATPAEVAAALEPFAAGANLSELLTAARSETSDLGETGTWDTADRIASSSRDTTRDVKGPIAKPAPALAKMQRGGKRWGRPAALVAAAALAGTSLLGIVLLSIRTPHGEVVVELADDVPKEMADKIRIEVRGNGDLKVADAEQGWTIDVSEGEYVARLAGGDDRFKLERDQVTVVRDRKAIVRVTLKRTEGQDDLAPAHSAAVAMTPAWEPTPEQQAFFDAVATMEPNAQVEAVREKLIDTNQVSGVKTTAEIRKNAVVRLELSADGVTAIWPVRALTALERLDVLSTASGTSAFSDLSPLQGTRLSALTCRFTAVCDLSPLTGIRLRFFDCTGSKVSDLSPLRGMPLAQLYVSDTPVSDLSPLEGMPLSDLEFGGTRVNDLRPLVGMPLRILRCSGSEVSDLGPLAGMRLERLSIQQNSISDLSPLKGMPLTHLNCQKCDVSDLSPLQGMPLVDLCCDQTRVADLGPLAGMPLTTLKCCCTPVSDLTPLKEVSLERLWCDLGIFDHANETVVRSLTLRALNGSTHVEELPPAEFWKRYDARRSAAIAFAEAAGHGSPAEQVAAVVAELKTLNDRSDAQVGALGHAVDDGVVSNASLILAPYTADITPLRAFAGLKRLTLTGGPAWLDLSPLGSLPLETLVCSEDISLRNSLVLRGMPTLATINGKPAKEYLDAITTRRIQSSGNSPKPAPPQLAPWQPTPEQQAFLDAAALLPVDQRIEAVATRLKAVNLRFDGDLKHVIEKGQVAKVDLAKAPVQDLWPLAALTDLRSLNVSGTRATDLAPLARLHALIALDCSDTGVRDLSPLSGLPLKTLRTYPVSPLNEGAVAVLRSLPDLETLNDASFEAFLARRELRDEVKQLQKALPAFPAERQLELVVELLKKLNPGYDGRIDFHQIDGDRVTKLSLAGAKDIVDLSPVAALPLTELSCRATGVTDLTPLAGVSLTYLDCQETGVCDLSPSAGMPLSRLACSSTGVSDLSPLQGMPLTYLHCSNTPVRDLAPLKDMPLTLLACTATEISDLSPLQGMPLTNFSCQATGVSDLAPLRGMPLTSLACGSAGVHDLSPLEGMRLEALSIGGSKVSDLSSLRGMPLEQLICDFTPVRDLSPLAGMPLRTLHCGNTAISDLSPLAGMPLRSLKCDHTSVADLSPLEGMPLEELAASVRWFDEGEETLLRALPLVSVNGRPAAEFWTAFEARQVSAEAFRRDAAELATDEQVAAVISRMKDLNEEQFGTLEHEVGGNSVRSVALAPSGGTHDLTPLQAFAGLKRLTVHQGLHSLDLSPLKLLPLEELTLPEQTARRNVPVLNTMAALSMINGRPAEEFLEGLVKLQTSTTPP